MKAGIEQKNLGQPDETVSYGEQGNSAKVALGFAGFGLGSESTVWLSTLRPGWSWLRNIKPDVPSRTARCMTGVRRLGPHSLHDG